MPDKKYHHAMINCTTKLTLAKYNLRLQSYSKKDTKKHENATAITVLRRYKIIYI